MKMSIAIGIAVFCLACGAQAKTSKKKAKNKVKVVKVEPVVSEPTLQVFAENTSFEQMLANREAARRDPAAFAPKARVIAVRRDLPMGEEEGKILPKDIVLNEGTSAGLNKGMNLKVYRRVTILDPYKNNKQIVMNLEYATVEVEHVETNLAVARITQIDSISKGFAIGTRGVMIGDFVGTP